MFSGNVSRHSYVCMLILWLNMLRSFLFKACSVRRWICFGLLFEFQTLISGGSPGQTWSRSGGFGFRDSGRLHWVGTVNMFCRSCPICFRFLVVLFPDFAFLVIIHLLESSFGLADLGLSLGDCICVQPGKAPEVISSGSQRCLATPTSVLSLSLSLSLSHVVHANFCPYKFSIYFTQRKIGIWLFLVSQRRTKIHREIM
jgi:hypothetical protein